MDKLMYPMYSENQKELKYVFDSSVLKYIVNKDQCCYYSPISKHTNCPHQHDCIFKREYWEYYDETLHETITLIKGIRKIMKEYEEILEDYLNGIIRYHPTLDDCYNIQIYKNHYGEIKTQVKVTPKFKNMIHVRMENLKLELRDLNRELYRLKKEDKNKRGD